VPFALPKGWVWVKLGEIAEELSTGPFGSTLHKSDYITNGIPLINPTNIVNGNIIANEKITVSETTKTRLEKYLLKTGDFVIARRGDLSKCGIVQEYQNGWICGTGSFFMRILNTNKNFFQLAYTSTSSQKYLLKDSIGQTMDNLNQSLLSKLPLALPSLAEQHAIVERVDRLLAFVNALEQQVQERKTYAEQLMQAVLKEAFAA
jgi:type I restriction enzyme, S subunit